MKAKSNKPIGRPKANKKASIDKKHEPAHDVGTKPIGNTPESQTEKGRPKSDQLDLKTSISTTISERRKQQFEDIVKLSDMSVAEALRHGMDLIEDEIILRRLRLKRLEKALGVSWYWRI